MRPGRPPGRLGSNGIVRFQADGLPVVSLYCRVDPGASRREVRAQVDSLLDQRRSSTSAGPRA
jgi:hypothetical protein